MVLYDPFHFVNFIKDNNKLSFEFYKAFRKQDYEALKNGTPIQIDLSKTEETYCKLYCFNVLLDDYSFEYETPTYIYRLKNVKNYKSSNQRK